VLDGFGLCVPVASRIADLNTKFGIRPVLSRGKFVMGDLPLRLIHSSIAHRSYVYPSAATTGSRMVCCVIGQENISGSLESSSIIQGSSSSSPRALVVKADKGLSLDS